MKNVFLLTMNTKKLDTYFSKFAKISNAPKRSKIVRQFCEKYKMNTAFVFPEIARMRNEGVHAKVYK